VNLAFVLGKWSLWT